MNEAKQFPIEVVAGLTTGINLGNFRDIHECAEWVAGHSIWTHEFAERSLCERLKGLVFAQIPELKLISFEAMPRNDVPTVVDILRVQFGATVTLTKGTGERTEHPIASLERIASGKPIDFENQ